MLKFEGSWRFDSPGEIAEGVIDDFFELIRKIASQGTRQNILEHFKSYFARSAGSTSYWSSSEGWAETDLVSYMNFAARNAPLFIEAFYDACETLKQKNPDIFVPGVDRINLILQTRNADYQIQPPHLLTGESRKPISIPRKSLSIEQEAQEKIWESLHQSEKLLQEGRSRQAVQEILWLLESVSTLFEGREVGTGTVQGKYFNKIIADLRKNNRGTTLEQVLNWASTLHGYLSSPTGGGVRHGINLKHNIEIGPHEARLFCNLVRSYAQYLMDEHERLERR